MRSAYTTGTWRSLAAVPVVPTGGVLCRPTVAAQVQQPGRERPRRQRTKLFPVLFEGRSRPGCKREDQRQIRRQFRREFDLECARNRVGLSARNHPTITMRSTRCAASAARKVGAPVPTCCPLPMPRNCQPLRRCDSTWQLPGDRQRSFAPQLRLRCRATWWSCGAHGRSFCA